MMNREVLERPILTTNLILEPIGICHAKKLYELLSSEEIYEFIPQNPPTNVDTLREKFSNWSKRGSPDGTEIWLNYAMFMPSIDEYVGTLQATLISSGISYIAYDVAPKLWRMGVGKEGCIGLIKFIYKHSPSATIGALVDTRNVRSWKLLESIGFKREKKIENADFFKGSVSDEYLYLLDFETFQVTAA